MKYTAANPFFFAWSKSSPSWDVFPLPLVPLLTATGTRTLSPAKSSVSACATISSKWATNASKAAVASIRGSKRATPSVWGRRSAVDSHCSTLPTAVARGGHGRDAAGPLGSAASKRPGACSARSTRWSASGRPTSEVAGFACPPVVAVVPCRDAGQSRPPAPASEGTPARGHGTAGSSQGATGWRRQLRR